MSMFVKTIENFICIDVITSITLRDEHNQTAMKWKKKNYKKCIKTMKNKKKVKNIKKIKWKLWKP